MIEEKAGSELHKDAAWLFKQMQEAAPPNNSNCTAFTSCKLSREDEEDIMDSAGEWRMNS